LRWLNWRIVTAGQPVRLWLGRIFSLLLVPMCL
jgi:hypothetical protein